MIQSRTFLDEKILYRTLEGSVLSGTSFIEHFMAFHHGIISWI